MSAAAFELAVYIAVLGIALLLLYAIGKGFDAIRDWERRCLDDDYAQMCRRMEQHRRTFVEMR